MKAYNTLFHFVKKHNCNCVKNAKMSDYTTFKIGGHVSLLIEPNDEKSLGALMQKCNQLEITPFVLGKGSNLLITDNDMDKVVIHIAEDFSEMRLIDDYTIECQTGISLIRLCKFAQRNGLSGLEFAFGIPGSVGGAIFMNAGAYGGEMKDVVIKTNHVDNEGNTGHFMKDDLDFSYRHSVYRDNNFIITSAQFKLYKDDKEKILDRMKDYMTRRHTKQPLDLPSAGSVFKRPIGHYASLLIDNCGLKGLRVGDAMVSLKHAGFIVNVGQATAKDVEGLILKVQEEVFKQTGVNLETEVIRVN